MSAAVLSCLAAVIVQALSAAPPELATGGLSS
jgi:hypothetical protein